jgi:elongation factor P
MQTVMPSEFKRGMALLIEGAPQLLEEFHSSGTAQSKHKIHARLRNLKTGRIADRAFTENDRVPVAEMEHRKAQFSYKRGEEYVFLDSRTFEELVLTADQAGDRRWFFKENDEYRTLLLEGKLVDIALPLQVTLQVVETVPPIRGGSDSNWKPARLDTGLEIMVPLFIAQGEWVRVDTYERKYAGKETSAK